MSFLAPAPMQYAVFNIRARSLLRGTVLVIGSVVLAMVWAGFPNVHASLLLIVPVFLAAYGTWETSRCLRPRWSFYHGGVLLLLYADVLALALIVFLLLYPYARWLQAS
ncbi:MAG: permease [Acidobacteriaceae bacterium]